MKKQIVPLPSRINEFKGRIGKDEKDGAETGEFAPFIFANEGKIVHLDIYFDNDETYKMDKEGYFEFCYYYDLNQKLFGGFSFRIKIKDSDDFFYDNRFNSKRLFGFLKL